MHSHIRCRCTKSAYVDLKTGVPPVKQNVDSPNLNKHVVPSRGALAATAQSRAPTPVGLCAGWRRMADELETAAAAGAAGAAAETPAPAETPVPAQTPVPAERPAGGAAAASMSVQAVRPRAPAKEFAVGCKVSALASFDQTYHPAEVIDVKRPAAGGGGGASTSSDAAAMSYYVHYHGCDKRLDEWVPGARLEPFTAAVGGGAGGGGAGAGAGAAGAGDAAGGTPGPAGDQGGITPGMTPGTGEGRKLTRNLKRRYNEINNVGVDASDLTPMDASLEREHDGRAYTRSRPAQLELSLCPT